MGWIRRETEKGTTQYICPNCHDYHEFREDFGEQTFSENFIFCRRCGARNGTGTAPTLTPPNEWVNRVRELDELYTKLQIVTGFTAEQLLEIFAAGYTLEICGNGKSGGSCPAERAADDGGAAGVTARENQE